MRGNSLPRQFANLLKVSLAAEQERWALWSPVLIGAGIAVYFALPSEPPVWIGVFMAIAALLLAGLSRAGAIAAIVLVAAGLAALGFSAAQLRTALVAGPVLDRPYGPAGIEGTIVAIEGRQDGSRIVLEDVTLRGRDAEKTPTRIRVTLRRDAGLQIGQRISLFGKLSPPAPPAAPGAYDFRRSAWYDGLGATGFAFGEVRPVRDGRETGILNAIRVRVAATRHQATQRIQSALPGEAGAVAAALITGDRGAIGKETVAAMRDSGLAHLLAISGLHLGLVAGILFFTVRTVLALFERLTLYHPIKKWAAGAAMVGSFGYFLLAGAPVPTQRAFIMVGLVLLAVVLDREAISMRLVAFAATAILLVFPETLLGASFQMSFSAVIALVAFYESLQSGMRNLARRAAAFPGGRVALYIGGVAITTLIAGTATGIIGLHHFGRIAVYGLPANLVAVPLTALWIMPWAVAAALLMPVGLESWALAPMGWGIEVLTAIARTVAGWPGAVRLVPTMSNMGLGLATLGGLWLCVWRLPWRYAGVVGIVAGLAGFAVVDGPDILIAGNGRLMAVRMTDGTLSLSDRRRERHAASAWLEQNGQESAQAWPRNGETPDGRVRCDLLACIYRAKGMTVSLVRDGRALDEECRRDGILVSTVPVRGSCPGPSLVIDRFDLWHRGAHAIWLTPGGPRIETVEIPGANRPWSPAPAGP